MHVLLTIHVQMIPRVVSVSMAQDVVRIISIIRSVHRESGVTISFVRVQQEAWPRVQETVCAVMTAIPDYPAMARFAVQLSPMPRYFRRTTKRVNLNATTATARMVRPVRAIKPT